MFSHQPTWDNCQQILQTLFTTEERERILLEARKNVPGADGRPSQLPNIIDLGFPLDLTGTSTLQKIGSGWWSTVGLLWLASVGQQDTPPIWLRLKALEIVQRKV